MDVKDLEKKFGKMGARLKVRGEPRNRWTRIERFALDVRSDKRGEFFELTAREDRGFRVLAVDPDGRHLLLEAADDRERFLCGHDERHWFVAGVPPSANSVRAAKEALMPPEARDSLRKNRVRVKNRNRRKNKGYVRQGEWFFVPEPDLEVDTRRILPNEPLQRGGGKPHMAEELYREGGETVHVCSAYRNGITVKAYKELIERKPEMRKLNWRVMSRNPRAYVRGKIRHPDHKTVVLKFWHRVVPNREVMSEKVAFLD
jgi:hypothetical protein